MKPLAISAILLVVIANATFSYRGINGSMIERLLDQGAVHLTSDKASSIPVLPIVGSVALVGISLLMGTAANGNPSRENR